MKTNTIFAFVSFVAMLVATGLQAQTDFTHVSNQPVFDVGAAEEWDDYSVFRPAIVSDGDTLRMWYTGVDQSEFDNPHYQSGYAWSVDGVTWNRYAGNPVLTNTLSWEALDVSWCTVRKEGDTYQMWYGARGNEPQGIGYATSTAGVNWAKHSDAVVLVGPSGDRDSRWIAAGTVIRESNGQYKMWYLGTLNTSVSDWWAQTGLATSPDGINWVKYDDPATTAAPFANSDPVPKHGIVDVDWDGNRAYGAHVMETTAGYEMWYTGAKGLYFHDPQTWVGYATSADGISWVKWPQNPIISTPAPGASYYYPGTILKLDANYHFWYSSSSSQLSNDFKSTVGYATSPILVSVEGQEDDTNIPSQYRLFQNYPNPFNPATTISYDLAKPSKVLLEIYNLRGQLIETLVNEFQAAGSHGVPWDASGLSSGVKLRLEILLLSRRGFC